MMILDELMLRLLVWLKGAGSNYFSPVSSPISTPRFYPRNLAAKAIVYHYPEYPS
jgi:hypothetical protein